MTRLAALLALSVAALAASGCRTTVDPLEQDLAPDQYFQRAIEASDRDNYRLAMRYYEAFKARYADDVDRNVWADYEIAVIHHKLGQDDRAIELFDALLAKYEQHSEDAKPLPAAPRVLAEKVKANILASRKPAAPQAPAGS
jgi:outer membrane protein assembly factor BamD (BamD/ComL family)